MEHPAGRGIAKPARFVVAVASGKGGVGKSTLSLNLALALAEGGADVALLDADVYGPDIPRMLNLTRRKGPDHLTLWSSEAEVLEPLERHGIKIMSAGFLVAEDQSISLDGALVDLLVMRMIAGVEWGEPDWLVIDLPPGTADLQQQLFRRVRLSGVLLVVTPQDLAHLDAKKVLEMVRRAGVPVLGAVENMSGLVCPSCEGSIDVFPRVSEERSIWASGVERLGSIPLDPVLAASADAGTPVVVSEPHGPGAARFRALAGSLVRVMNARSS